MSDKMKKNQVGFIVLSYLTVRIMTILALFSHEKVRISNSISTLIKSYRNLDLTVCADLDNTHIEWSNYECIIIDIYCLKKVPLEVIELFETKLILIYDKIDLPNISDYHINKKILYPKEKDWLLFQIDSLRNIKNHRPDSPKIFIKADGNYKKINLSEILYVEGLKDYVRIKTINNQFITRISIKYIQSILDNKQFIRLHKSYIVNLERIDEIYSDSVRVIDKTIPIGRYSKKDLLDAVILI